MHDAFAGRGWFPLVEGGGVSGEHQVNDTAIHHDEKLVYRKFETAWMASEDMRGVLVPTPDRVTVLMMRWYHQAVEICEKNGMGQKVSAEYERMGFELPLDPGGDGTDGKVYDIYYICKTEGFSI